MEPNNVANLTVKNIPEELCKKPKESAAQHRRSLSNEAIVLLDETLRSQRVDPEAFLSQLKTLRDRLSLPPLTDEFLREAKNPRRT